MQQQTSEPISAAQFKRELRAFKADKLLSQMLETDESLSKAINENKFGCICMQAGKLALAQTHLLAAHTKLQQLIPDIAVTNVHMNLGNLYSQLKQFDTAVQHYETVIALSPYTTEPDQRNVAWSGRLNSYNAYIDAHTNLACLLANMDRLQESYTFCLKAISMNPLNFEAQTNFGDLLRQLGRKDEAIEHTWHQIVKFTNVIDDSYTRPQAIDCTQVKTEQAEGLNILCVKWGKKYGADYVNKLYAGIKRNTTLEFTFHCLTDDPADLNSEIRVLELEGGWTGWWGKATLFTLQLKGRMFYIDLDMIVTRNIDEILNYRGTFSILRTDEIACEKANKNGYNSSLMAWNSNEQFVQVYQALHRNAKNIQKFIVRFDFWLEMMIQNAEYLQDLFPTQISDYVQECQESLPLNTRIVCFPRSPKPHDASATWIAEYWTM